jgi:hypothetical protein
MIGFLGVPAGIARYGIINLVDERWNIIIYFAFNNIMNCFSELGIFREVILEVEHLHLHRNSFLNKFNTKKIPLQISAASDYCAKMCCVRRGVYLILCSDVSSVLWEQFSTCETCIWSRYQLKRTEMKFS